MIEFIKDQWDKILGVLTSIGVAVFLFYRRFFRVEDTLAKHIQDDQELKKKLDAGIADLGEMKVQLARHDVIVSETRDDVKELRADVKKLLERP